MESLRKVVRKIRSQMAADMSRFYPSNYMRGREVELQIRLPRAAETTRAIVRHRNVYRHGFEFVQPLHGIFEAITSA
jgi:hypothetical protein